MTFPPAASIRGCGFRRRSPLLLLAVVVQARHRRATSARALLDLTLVARGARDPRFSWSRCRRVVLRARSIRTRCRADRVVAAAAAGAAPTPALFRSASRRATRSRRSGIFACASLVCSGRAGRSAKRAAPDGSSGRSPSSVSSPSIAAIVQRAQSKDLLYGVWRPLDAGARPYGPFVNRNHFATWVDHGVPARVRLPAGSRAAAVTPPHSSRSGWRTRSSSWERCASGSSSAVCLMTLAVLISTSRSGIIGLMGAFACSTALTRGRGTPAVRRWTIFQGTLLAVVVAVVRQLRRADADDSTRRSVTRAQAGRGRVAIWARRGPRSSVISPSPAPVPARSARPSPFTRRRNPDIYRPGAQSLPAVDG